jgi:hypothetical protein
VACLPLAATAGTIELAWDPVPGAQGYRIYYGTSAGSYPQSLDVGNTVSTSLSGLTDCSTWFVAVKAYNSMGESAQFSNEISGWARPSFNGLGTIQVAQGDQLTLNIDGANFAAGAQLVFDDTSIPQDISGNPLVRIDSYSVVSCTRVQALMTVEATAPGVRAMTVGAFGTAFDVVNPDTVYGAQNATLSVAFDAGRTDINQSDVSTRDRVDGQDLVWLAYAFNSSEGQGIFNPDADLDGDGMVDGTDLAFLAAGFGKCWNGAQLVGCP